MAAMEAERLFEIRHRSRGSQASTAIAQIADADAATISFHAALTLLDAAEHDGDVVIIKHHPSPRVVLRHPLFRLARLGTRSDQTDNLSLAHAS